MQKVSPGDVKGPVIHFKSSYSQSEYANMIVVVENLDLNERIFILKSAKAIISEKGGFTSHGAIVAREFGTPCCILRGASHIVKEGSEVEIRDNEIEIEAEVLPPLAEKSFSRIIEDDWVCYRPYRYSTFINSLRKPAFNDILRTIHISDRDCDYRNDEKGYWLKNFPEEEIVERILHDKEWFDRIIEERKTFYQKSFGWLESMLPLIESMKQEDLGPHLETVRELYPQYIAYLYVTNILSDKIHDEFFSLLEEHLPTDLFFNYVNEAFHSTYVEYMVERNIQPADRSKEMVFPPPPMIFFRTIVNYDAATRYDSHVLEVLPQEKAHLFEMYSRVCPLLSRLAEETTVGVRALRIVINHLLFHCGKSLVAQNKIEEIPEVLDFTFEDLMHEL